MPFAHVELLPGDHSFMLILPRLIGPAEDRVGVAREWSPDYPGYLASAVDAASRGVSELAASDR